MLFLIYLLFINIVFDSWFACFCLSTWTHFKTRLLSPPLTQSRIFCFYVSKEVPRGDSQTTHATIFTDSVSLLQKVKGGMGSPDYYVSVVDIFLGKLLWVYCPGHAEWKEMTEQIDWQAKQPSQVACILNNLKCWEAWDTTCVHKAKGVTPSITWRREAWKEMMMMSWCLMSSDVIWHIRDKLWPMPKHGSIKSTYARCMRV